MPTLKRQVGLWEVREAAVRASQVRMLAAKSENLQTLRIYMVEGQNPKSCLLNPMHVTVHVHTHAHTHNKYMLKT